jgi:hypothetical protein
MEACRLRLGSTAVGDGVNDEYVVNRFDHQLGQADSIQSSADPTCSVLEKWSKLGCQCLRIVDRRRMWAKNSMCGVVGKCTTHNSVMHVAASRCKLGSSPFATRRRGQQEFSFFMLRPLQQRAKCTDDSSSRPECPRVNTPHSSYPSLTSSRFRAGNLRVRIYLSYSCQDGFDTLSSSWQYNPISISLYNLEQHIVFSLISHNDCTHRTTWRTGQILPQH